MGWNDKMDNNLDEKFEFFIDDNVDDEIEKYARSDETETEYRIDPTAEHIKKSEEEQPEVKKKGFFAGIFGKKQ